ncbi:N-acyl amino acid synthase FeeM domain-containing protein [Roseateles violae]|uniref:N-acyl amino acid synthase FeeM catalytic core domain-containing protein n=1 Tax=Roseateles violae TaxID=3058042 RepID=A0ABT8DVD5_9BURK|nr:hypothetical protein [Pelomonas sp. PFR6]MDN3922254.1 hypothetical protein [Pelomonas sp. PFR6]
MTKPGSPGGFEGGLSERLPFRVTIANRDELTEVARMRALAYGRHLPELGQRLSEPEPADFEWGCEVIVAKSKLDGTILGTLRTHTNVLKPLPLEASMTLPARYQGKRLVEATRLSVQSGGNASLVRNALFKAFYLYSLGQGADWLVVAGRRPVDRIYDGLLYTDVAESGAFYPMAHAGGLPHRVMSMAVAEAEPIWRQAEHPLYGFAFQTRHPDIDLDAVRDLSVVWGVTNPTPGVRNHALHSSIPLRRASGAVLT